MAAVKANREKLLHVLQTVRPGLSPREILEQSSCYIFRRGNVLTYNDEIACRMKTGLPKDFEGAVQAAPLVDLLQKITEDEVGLEATETELIVTGLRKKSGIRLEADTKSILDFVSKIEPPEEWKQLPEDFADAVHLVQSCAGKDERTDILMFLHIHPKWIEATDNYQVARYRLKTGFKESVLVRSSALKSVAALAMEQFSDTQTWLHFRNTGGLVFSCRRYAEMSFPSLDECLKIDGEPLSLPGGLKEAAERAAIFSGQNAEDDNVLVELSPGKLRIRGTGPNGWHSETKKAKYSGPTISFLASPAMLVELSKKCDDCRVGPERLWVDGGKYTYMSCLGVSDNGKGESEEGDSEEGGEE